MTLLKTHWENVYSENLPDEVSWFQTKSDTSLRLVQATGLSKDQPILDVGGGASRFADGLLEAGFQHITVLDISSHALDHAKKRLAEKSGQIDWVVADVCTYHAKQQVSLWHDRAVLHFLTQENDRQGYVRTLKQTLSKGGHLVLATFALDGPKQCSSLDVVRYDSKCLQKLLGEEFELLETFDETHVTPWDTEQKFIYCRFRRLG